MVFSFAAKIDDGFCKLAGSYESLVNTTRGLNSIVEFVIGIPRYVPKILAELPENFQNYVAPIDLTVFEGLKPVSHILGGAKNYLTFIELPMVVRKTCDAWNKQETSYCKKISMVFQVGQKGIESFFLIPNTWKLIDLGKYCTSFGNATGLSFITPTFILGAKEVCVFVSAFFSCICNQRDLNQSRALYNRKTVRLEGLKSDEEDIVGLQDVKNRISQIRAKELEVKQTESKIKDLDERFLQAKNSVTALNEKLKKLQAVKDDEEAIKSRIHKKLNVNQHRKTVEDLSKTFHETINSEIGQHAEELAQKLREHEETIEKECQLHIDQKTAEIEELNKQLKEADGDVSNLATELEQAKVTLRNAEEASIKLKREITLRRLIEGYTSDEARQARRKGRPVKKETLTPPKLLEKIENFAKEKAELEDKKNKIRVRPHSKNEMNKIEDEIAKKDDEYEKAKWQYIRKWFLAADLNPSNPPSTITSLPLDIQADINLVRDTSDRLERFERIFNYKIDKNEAQRENAQIKANKAWWGRAMDISKMAIVILGLTVVTGLTLTALAPFASAIAVTTWITTLLIGSIGLIRTWKLAFYSDEAKYPQPDCLKV